MLPVGSRAPEFTLPDQDGRDVSLTAFLNRGPLFLYFYPADFTPGCTREACAIRDIHDDILAAGFGVVGVSPQAPQRHEAFRERYSLPFALLADTDKLVIRMYEADGLFGLRVRRITYLIDPGRYIRDAVHAELHIGAHEALIRRALSTQV
jgi:thioredoxin-dependent peroxiredoxin